MTDIVVTVPKTFRHPWADEEPELENLRGLRAWAAEGDLPGEPWSGIEWEFSTWGQKPDIKPGERVYVVCEGKLRGYAALIRVEVGREDRFGQRLSFIRGGGAVAVTIPQPIVGFRGWRYRWWDQSEEVPFPDWRTA